MVKAGSQGRGLAEVAAQLDHEHAAVHGGYFFQQLVGAVVGAIVDQHQLEVVAHLLHHLLEASVQGGDILLFIVKRHDDGVFHHASSDVQKWKKFTCTRGIPFDLRREVVFAVPRPRGTVSLSTTIFMGCIYRW
jgi:hypothetical protein